MGSAFGDERMSPTLNVSLAERVLGVDSPDDHYASFARACYTITGEYVDPTELIAEGEALQHTLAGRTDTGMYEVDAHIVERSVIINALKRIFVDRVSTYVTFLKDWPVYEDLYAQHARPTESKAPSRALLVGTVSALSSAAFVGFSEDVLKTEAVIVDPYPTPPKCRHGMFVEANGLALPPDWSDSMRVVATNSLLTVLLDTEGRTIADQPNEQEARRTLFKQAYRVLEPGGSLLMNELPPHFDYSDFACESAYNQHLVATFADTLQNDLDATGFSDIAVGEAWEFSGVDYLFDPSRRFDQYERIPAPRFRTVYARKPEA